ncbi:Na(+)/H(+) antiporter subunit C [Arthrobacter oryzae]|jgi:multicomponent Na+:H+ antiporter subunit C|uniref:Na(+)/H(+) antiporter subunit C n=1 Tax=Arthrobacter oryzae TaxID=409290 RepID=UPI00278293ED|nr:Na(+)/H(+) antiporter subunit C [Arthrobacter oryzae]MDQ0078868.1 multicomponent Na+:H+ antiporter subunit C [Arthrobacter oryzae]
MSVNLTLLTVMGALYACGIYLIMERSLTRVLLGLMLLANATNLLILATGGYAGLAPMFSKDTDPRDYNDPLPQALILTSIVISFAVTAFMLGIIYRSWVLARRDEIQDDVEDIRVAETPSFDAEDDSEIPVETSEFPLTMIGSDGKGISDSGVSGDRTTGDSVSGDSPESDQADGPEAGAATVKAGDHRIQAKDAAAEEKPGSQNVTPGPEGGVK